jgi:cytidylate kinase
LKVFTGNGRDIGNRRKRNHEIADNLKNLLMNGRDIGNLLMIEEMF